jgi:ABC-type lipoprotein export system ATPase subunit
LLSLEKVTKIYHGEGNEVVAVRDVDLELQKKDFLLIAGRSGSGKTTLLSLIGALTRPTSGRVVLDGTDVWTLDDGKLSAMRNRRIGFMFQFPSLIPTLNVANNLRLAASFHDVDYDIDGRVKELISLVGLQDKARVYPNQLSGGQQRRVAIARALMNGPDLILADEPTGDLDEETEKEIMQILKKTNDEGAAVVLISHSPELVKFAKRRFWMSDGALIKRE